MASLNLDLDYFDRPEIRRLCGLLGKNSADWPIRLKCYVGKHHAEDGRLVGYSATEIEGCIKWHGKPGGLIAALVKVEILREIGDGYEVVGWVKEQGHIHAYREKAKHAAQVRWEKVKPRDAPSNAPSNAQAEHCNSNPPNPPAGGETDSDSRPRRETREQRREREARDLASELAAEAAGSST